MANRWFVFTGTVFLLLISGFSSHSVKAPAGIYISPTGDDQASGRRSRPVLTLERAAELARKKAGKGPVTVWLSGGTYHLSEPLRMGPGDGGTAEAPIIWRAVPGEKPVISGGIPLESWQAEPDGRWSAPLPETIPADFRSLFVNGRRAVRARFPDDGFLRVEQAGEDDRTNFFFKEGDFPRMTDVRKLELILLHDWSISRVGVASIDWGSSHLYTADTIGALSPSFFTISNWEEHPRYYLENAAEFLDRPGEWYGDLPARRVYYLPLPGENIHEIEAVIPLAPQLLIIKGDEGRGRQVGFISFQGITFEYTAWPLPAGGYCGIQACMFDNRQKTGNQWDQVPAVIELDYAEHCYFRDCVISHAGGSGIWIREGCRDCTIEGCHVYDISGNGINIGEGQDRHIEGIPWWKAAPEQACRNTRIANCLVEDCGRQFYGAVGIWGGLVAQTTIERNEVRNLPYTGISIGWMWDTIATPCRENTIASNHIHHIMNLLSDGGGIYMLGLQPGSRITGNLIHDVSVNAGRAESNGMFLDEGIKDVLVEQNIIYHIARSPLRFHRASTNIVRNNVLMCSDEVPPIRYNRTQPKDIRQEGNIILNQSLPRDMDTLRTIIQQRLADVGTTREF